MATQEMADVRWLMTRRAFLRNLALASAGAALVACSPVQPGGAPAPGRGPRGTPHRRLAGAGEAADLVVVGQRPELHAPGVGACGEVFGGEGAVGNAGVRMQVGIEQVHGRRLYGAVRCGAGTGPPARAFRGSACGRSAPPARCRASRRRRRCAGARPARASARTRRRRCRGRGCRWARRPARRPAS